MDAFDRDKFAAVYRLLAEILEHDRTQHREHGAAFSIGDIMRRVFTGKEFEPPDELLEQVALLLRGEDFSHMRPMAAKLRKHAEKLEQYQPPE